MSKLAELLKQQEELAARIEAAQAEARTEGLQTVATLADQLGEPFAIDVIKLLSERFSITDFRVSRKRGGKIVQRLPAKYRDPASGKTWSGKGREPAWLSGKDRAAFLIA
ncbi:H-NS family nucleoid-associated regulatory protein [Burkholderia aenigmatica]|uniref:H-NS histone family protein n=1 Tax=Burkholderia aenigmatica TaxID=2015348 RepID=A0A228IIC2_9BURK|nr:H-NS histone family protein [Burkholderia aenigmatica]OXI42188.1 H-NS histone family protein [Burkholderia aenigmatica]